MQNKNTVKNMIQAKKTRLHLKNKEHDSSKQKHGYT